MKGHTQDRQYLHNLYTDKFVYISSISSSEQPVEDEKLFWYRGISFQFAGTGFRVPEQVVLFVWVPQALLPGGYSVSDHGTAYEDWLLRLLAEPVNALSKEFQNDKKDAREKPYFSMQIPGVTVQRRNGCLYAEDREAFRLRINYHFPLINGKYLNGKSSYKGVKLLLDTICELIEKADTASLRGHILTYDRQLEIRRFIRERNLVAFVAEGSILPRQGDTDAPMEGAVPFQTPPELQVEIPVPDGGVMVGMGIKRGITIITGGGYSGKSTLLDALEQGIYFHVKGDGREYVISDETACKIYAEDGRNIQRMDISPFFSYMPGADTHNFQTLHASGSVSQAANIIEAVYGGARCLLIDEDTSATNFMIRDEGMRELVKHDPIVPFTDRIEELKEMGISTILVIGGSSEYLKYGDCILLLEEYRIYDRTKQVHQSGMAWREKEHLTVSESSHTWMEKKIMPHTAQKKEFLFCECVQIENARYIKIDDYVSDITRITDITEESQINSLAWLLEKLLTEEGKCDTDLKVRCREAVESLFSDTFDILSSSRVHRYGRWLGSIRSLDLVMAVSRLRNLHWNGR